MYTCLHIHVHIHTCTYKYKYIWGVINRVVRDITKINGSRWSQKTTSDQGKNTIPSHPDPIPSPFNPTWTQFVPNLEPIWPAFLTQFEALENERHSAAICPLLVRQDENDRLAAEWRPFLKPHFAMHSEGHNKNLFHSKCVPLSRETPCLEKKQKRAPLRSHMPTFCFSIPWPQSGAHF